MLDTADQALLDGVLHARGEAQRRAIAKTITLLESTRADHRSRADELLKKSFGQFTLPLLILHGTADKVTKPSGSKEFYEKAGSSDKTLKLYEGHFHDLLADVGKQQVMADIQAWIDAHMGNEIPRPRRELRT